MRTMTWLAGAAAASLVAAGAAGQQTTETFMGGSSGADVYKTYCASCHGAAARGDGPLADDLRHAPPDLTTFAKRAEDGKFDAAKMHRIIDGRDPVKGHGGPDMPVWGDALKRSSEGFSEEAVRERIAALVSYLKSLQRK